MTNASAVWVWVGLLWNERVQFALEHYGDRITDVAIFAWSVDRHGGLTETFNPALLDDYRQRWPHIRFWGCFRNMDDPDDGPRAIFDASGTRRQHAGTSPTRSSRRCSRPTRGSMAWTSTWSMAATPAPRSRKRSSKPSPTAPTGSAASAPQPFRR
nr:hypothetical protein [Nesterenkonia sp. PF2B19]